MYSRVILLLFLQLCYSYYIVDTVEDCYTCISNSSENYVCRNDFNDNVSYCCENGEDDDKRSCRTNDFCSNDIEDYAMRVVTCPFQYRQCGYPRSTIVLDDVNEMTLIELEDRFEYRFEDQSICYYEIYANDIKYDLASNDFKITLNFTQIDNVMVQIVNGTDRFVAEGSQVVDYYTSYEWEYTADNNHIFVILTGDHDDDDLPDPGKFQIEAYFWLDVPEDESVVIEETEDGEIKRKTITNGEVTDVVIIWTDKQRLPQDKLTVLLGLSVLALLLWGICAYCCKLCKKKKVNEIEVQDEEIEAVKGQDDIFARTMTIIMQKDEKTDLDDTNKSFLNTENDKHVIMVSKAKKKLADDLDGDSIDSKELSSVDINSEISQGRGGDEDQNTPRNFAKASTVINRQERRRSRQEEINNAMRPTTQGNGLKSSRNVYFSREPVIQQSYEANPNSHNAPILDLSPSGKPTANKIADTRQIVESTHQQPTWKEQTVTFTAAEVSQTKNDIIHSEEEEDYYSGAYAFDNKKAQPQEQHHQQAQEEIQLTSDFSRSNTVKNRLMAIRQGMQAENSQINQPVETPTPDYQNDQNHQQENQQQKQHSQQYKEEQERQKDPFASSDDEKSHDSFYF